MSLSPADIFFFLFFREMDARGIAKVPKVVPGPKLSIGLSASVRSPFSLLDEGRLSGTDKKIWKKLTARILKKKENGIF